MAHQQFTAANARFFTRAKAPRMETILLQIEVRAKTGHVDIDLHLQPSEVVQLSELGYMLKSVNEYGHHKIIWK